MKNLYLESVWAPGAIPPGDWKYHNLRRVMFPIVDLLFFFAGLSAISHGTPAINDFFREIDITIYSYLMCVAAIMSLVGVSFPKLWALEMAGNSIILGLMSAFITSLTILTLSGDYSRLFPLFVSMISICQVVWRITLLGAEWQDRKIANKVKVALVKAQAKKESDSG